VACAQCPPGTYAGSTGASACDECGPGTYSDAVGANSSTTCVPCAAGWYSAIGANSSCLECPPGTYAGSTGASACDECGPGTYSDAVGANSSTTCVPCDDSWTCPPGSGLGLCLNPGSESATSCTPCPLGTFQNETNPRICSQCPDLPEQSSFGIPYEVSYTEETGSENSSACVTAVSVGCFLDLLIHLTRPCSPKLPS